jgi:hypothetical protein
MSTREESTPATQKTKRGSKNPISVGVFYGVFERKMTFTIFSKLILMIDDHHNLMY